MEPMLAKSTECFNPDTGFIVVLVDDAPNDRWYGRNGMLENWAHVTKLMGRYQENFCAVLVYCNTNVRDDEYGPRIQPCDVASQVLCESPILQVICDAPGGSPRKISLVPDRTGIFMDCSMGDDRNHRDHEDILKKCDKKWLSRVVPVTLYARQVEAPGSMIDLGVSLAPLAIEWFHQLEDEGRRRPIGQAWGTIDCDIIYDVPMGSQLVLNRERSIFPAGERAHEYKDIINEPAHIPAKVQGALDVALCSLGTTDVVVFAKRLSAYASTKPSGSEVLDIAWLAANLKMLFRTRRTDRPWSPLEVWERYCRDNASLSPVLDVRLRAPGGNWERAEDSGGTDGIAPISAALFNLWLGRNGNLNGLGGVLNATGRDAAADGADAPRALSQRLAWFLGGQPEPPVSEGDMPARLIAAVEDGKVGGFDGKALERHLGMLVESRGDESEVLLYAALVARRGTGMGDWLGQHGDRGLPRLLRTKLGCARVKAKMVTADALEEAIKKAWALKDADAGTFGVVTGVEDGLMLDVVLLLGARGCYRPLGGALDEERRCAR